MKLRNSVLVFLVCLISITNVVFVASADSIYTDVSENFWAYDDIVWATNAGLMNGTDKTMFSPNNSMTRAMLVTVLYRMEGEPEITEAAPFTDLTQSWYKNAVAWAYENQIVTGISDTQFAPTKDCTREQLVTMLYRYSSKNCYDIGATASLVSFADNQLVSKWANAAMQWACGAELVKGVVKDNVSYLTPNASGTRAQIATIIHRFKEKVKQEHTAVIDNAVMPTCTVNGLTEGSHCSVCKTVIITQNTIPATGHTETTDVAVEPTCTTDGLTEGSHCSKCKTTLVKQEIIKASHKYEETIKDKSTLTVTCSICGDSYEETIPEITVSVANTGTSSATINGYGSYTKSYRATATGGFGTLQYKFEVYTSATASSPASNLTKDFSEDNTYGISYRGYEDAISGYIMKVTVKDIAGNQTTYIYEF